MILAVAFASLFALSAAAPKKLLNISDTFQASGEVELITAGVHALEQVSTIFNMTIIIVLSVAIVCYNIIICYFKSQS